MLILLLFLIPLLLLSMMVVVVVPAGEIMPEIEAMGVPLGYLIAVVTGDIILCHGRIVLFAALLLAFGVLRCQSLGERSR